MATLNYHHLRYFWTIAHERNLTRAAQKLHVSPSALSIQLRQLEDRLGHALFDRRGRGLVLTEAGRIALAHADTIFDAGEELVATLQGRARHSQPPLRVGAVATLSRNFQLHWLRPLLARGDVPVSLHAGTLRELLTQLSAHALDVVLAHESVPVDKAAGWRSTLLARQPVSVVSAARGGAAADQRDGRVARPRRRAPRPAVGQAATLVFPQALDGQPMVLPGPQSALRVGFDTLLAAAGVRVQVLAEVDDMPMLRLLARETGALALVPPVVVADELRSGLLVERCSIPSLVESFYAITVGRRFPHPALRELVRGA